MRKNVVPSEIREKQGQTLLGLVRTVLAHFGTSVQIGKTCFLRAHKLGEKMVSMGKKIRTRCSIPSVDVTLSPRTELG